MNIIVNGQDKDFSENITIEALEHRVKEEDIRELILATNPDIEGDGTALYIAQRFKEYDITISRIAKGIPSGTNIEYATKAILIDAIEGRRKM